MHDRHEVAVHTGCHRPLQPVVELELVEPPFGIGGLDVLDHLLPILVAHPEVGVSGPRTGRRHAPVPRACRWCHCACHEPTSLSSPLFLPYLSSTFVRSIRMNPWMSLRVHPGL